MKPALVFVLLLIDISAASQIDVQQIRSIEPADTDYSDLAFLEQTLSGVRVVALGEQSHYGGAAFDAKVRLIMYLHEKLGYNVIAFESGFYDCSKAYEYISNRAPSDSANYLKHAIFGVWNTAELRILADYIDRTQRTDNPLILSGFDMQFAGSYAYNDLPADMSRLIRHLTHMTGKELLIDSVAFSRSLKMVTGLSNTFKKVPPADTLIVSNAIYRIRNALTEINDPSEYLQFWSRILDLLQSDFRRGYSVPPGRYNLRDSLMADNLMWLTREKFPNEKIILWGANVHFTCANSSIESDIHRSINWMGTHLKKSLGDKYYFMALTSYEGEFTHSWFMNMIARRKPKTHSVESLFFSFGYEHAFLDLRGCKLTANRSFSNSKIFGNRPLKMNVCDVADGIFYIQKMYPSRY